MLVRPKRAFPGTALLLRGSALQAIMPVLAVLVIYSLGVEWAFTRYNLEGVTLTTTPFTLVGLALSIFLGFRNNACYDRWWEARKLWGAQINQTRSMARMTLNLVRGDDPEIAAFHKEMVYRIIAYTHALKTVLREHPDQIAKELDDLLPDEEIAQLPAETNIPNAIAQRMGDRYREAYDKGWVHAMHLPLLVEGVNRFLDIQGGCERIKNTPVPLSYTILTHRIVGVYCVALPFGIHDTVGSLTPIVVLIIAFAFLGLDAVGTQIEDPFEEDPNDLPLEAISVMIENNLRQRLGETELRDKVQPVNGILL